MVWLTTGRAPSKPRSGLPRLPLFGCAVCSSARARRSSGVPNASTPAACNIKANCHNRQAETGSSGRTAQRRPGTVLITWLFSSEGRLRAESCYSQCARRACDALQKAWRQPARHGRSPRPAGDVQPKICYEVEVPRADVFCFNNKGGTQLQFVCFEERFAKSLP